MGALIFAFCVAMILLIVPIVGASRQQRALAATDDADLASWRGLAESPWGDLLLGSWAALSAIGGAFLIVRDHAIGWGWICVAVVYAFAIAAGRRSRARLRSLLDDRDVPALPDCQRSGRARSYRYLAVGVSGYVGTKIVGYAYPDDSPSAATTVIGLFALVMIGGGVGFVAVRTRMYLRGDDLAAKK